MFASNPYSWSSQKLLLWHYYNLQSIAAVKIETILGNNIEDLWRHQASQLSEDGFTGDEVGLVLKSIHLLRMKCENENVKAALDVHYEMIQDCKIDDVSMKLCQQDLSRMNQALQDHKYAVIVAEHLSALTPPVHCDVKSNTDEDKRREGNFKANAITGCCTYCDGKEDTYVLPLACEHMICFACLGEFFAAIMTDFSLAPAKCCQQELPEVAPVLALPREELHKYIKVLIEKQATAKMFCPNPRCSVFIDLDGFSGSIQCPACPWVLCVGCHGEAHPDVSCEEHELKKSEDSLKHLANHKGWKRCPGCRTFVQLKHGCNHMTCVCRYEFCYECGEKWRVCKGQCPLWNERNLIAEEDRRVMIQEENLGRALHLQERRVMHQEVQHHNWHGDECHHVGTLFEQTFKKARTKKRRVIRECSVCEREVPSHGFRCTSCHVVFCVRCGRNR